MTTGNVENPRYTLNEVLQIWMEKTPHFGGHGPHRYTDGPYCRYCLRPKNFDAKQFTEGYQ